MRILDVCVNSLLFDDISRLVQCDLKNIKIPSRIFLTLFTDDTVLFQRLALQIRHIQHSTAIFEELLSHNTKILSGILSMLLQDDFLKDEKDCSVDARFK